MNNELDLNLHDRQLDAFNSKATEILYGGAAGGGKSHLMRVAAIIWCTEIENLQVYLFRRLSADLDKNHMEGPSGFRVLLAGWLECGFCKIVESEIRFWNGSKIYLNHCQHEKDRFKYQGAEIHVLLIDELTHFSEKIYKFLRGRVRAPGISLPKKYDGLFPRIICGSNPGNIGHLWVKTAWVDKLKPMECERQEKSEGGMVRQYIPAKVEDNPTIMIDDPDYIERLSGLGSDALVKAMRDGDWNVVEGAFFDIWSDDLILKPFAIPDDWTKFRSFDWGFAKPFSVGWWAVVGDDYIHNGQVLPRGAMVRYREWYGCQGPDVGIRMNSDDVARDILRRERGDKIAYGVADPAIFASDDGPSIEEKMSKAGVYWRPADNKRVARAGAMGGWDEMRGRIKGDEYPMIYCFDTCKHSIRTIPSLMHDDSRAEDLDTTSEDHAADEWRYACMSRPYVKRLPKQTDSGMVRRSYFSKSNSSSWKTA
jgi:hypothetical protein